MARVLKYVFALIEVALVVVVGVAVHRGNTSLINLGTVAIAINSAFVVISAKAARKKRACCS